MICAFTGHRPEKLPWGTNEADERCLALKARLAEQIRLLHAEGAESFACGMARGCDFYFAEAVLAQGLPLVAWLPCPTQPDRWGTPDQLRYRSLLTRCEKVILVSQVYTPHCMTRRNRTMVDHGDMLLSVWDGSPGGTGATVSYALSQGKPVIGLWR